MRKHQPPWSVRGVSQEARAKAAKAARRRRMTIGEWVDTTLIATANDELGSGGATRAAATSPNTFPGMSQDASGGAAPSPAISPAGGGAREVAPVPSALAETLARLAHQIEKTGDAGRAMDETVAQFVERLDGIERGGHVLETLAARFSDLDRRDRRLLAIADRLVANERKNEQRLAVLASAMNVLAEKIAGRPAEKRSEISADDLARTLDALKRSIDDLAARVDETTPVTLIETTPPPRPARARRAATNGRMADDRVANGDDILDEGAPVFDYEVLNEHAIRNTRGGAADDDDGAPARRGFVSRLFGGG